MARQTNASEAADPQRHTVAFCRSRPYPIFAAATTKSMRLNPSEGSRTQWRSATVSQPNNPGGQGRRLRSGQQTGRR